MLTHENALLILIQHTECMQQIYKGVRREKNILKENLLDLKLFLSSFYLEEEENKMK